MAAGNTYVALASNTLTGTATSVTFSSISGAYTDLVIVVRAKVGASSENNYLIFNSDTAANYSRTTLRGQGSAASSVRASSASQAYIDSFGDTNSAEFDSNQIAHIMNYSNATTYKTVLSRANRAGNGVDAIVNLWRNTAAITTISVNSTGTYQIGSTFTLYGIAAA